MPFVSGQYDAATRSRSLAFTIDGLPIPQGSKNVGRRKDGSSYVFEDGAAKLRPWRTAVEAEARAALFAVGWPGAGKHVPVRLRIDLYLPRPKSVTVAKRPQHVVKPDVDKLLRGVMDALTRSQVYVDDAQVCDVRVRKHYADGVAQGARVTVLIEEEA